MKPSISMLAWYMRDYHPQCSIKNDTPSISGIRFLLDENIKLSADYAYVGNASIFFDDMSREGNYILVHCQSYLLFTGVDYDVLLNALLGAVDFYDIWEKDLRIAASQNARLEDFVDLGEKVMGDFFVICDSETCLLEASEVDSADISGNSWEEFFAHHKVSSSAMNSKILNEKAQVVSFPHNYPQKIYSDNPYVASLIVQHLFQEGEPVAYFALNQKKDSPCAMQMQVIPVFCEYLIYAYEFTDVKSPVQSSYRIFVNLIKGEELDKKVLNKFVTNNSIIDYRIIYITNSIRNDPIHSNVLLKFLRSNSILCANLDNGALTALIDDKNWREYLSKVFEQSGFRGIRCGVSTRSSDVNAISNRFKQAEFVIHQAPPMDGIYCCEDFAFSYFLDMVRQIESVDFLLHPAIEILDNYDQHNNNELLLTLKVFYRQNKNLQKTLEALNIHRSTLKYRLQRIEELTGINLQSIENDAYIRFTLWVKDGEI